MASRIDSSPRWSPGRHCSFWNTGLTQKETSKKNWTVCSFVLAEHNDVFILLRSLFWRRADQDTMISHVWTNMQSEAPVPPPSHGKGGPLEQIGAFCGFFHLASDGILSLFQIPRHHFLEVIRNDINSASKVLTGSWNQWSGLLRSGYSNYFLHFDKIIQSTLSCLCIETLIRISIPFELEVAVCIVVDWP